MFTVIKNPGCIKLPGTWFGCVSQFQHRVVARREERFPNAPAILRARELSIRQHMILFIVPYAEIYISHVSFQFDDASIPLISYYVNRFCRIFFKLIFPGPFCQYRTDLLDDHYHHNKQRNGRPQHIALISVITVLKCNGTQTTTAYHSGHR